MIKQVRRSPDERGFLLRASLEEVSDEHSLQG